MRRLLPFVLLSVLVSSTARAQFYNAPALQPSVISDREYNFVAASGNGAGTSLIFQWREALVPGWQLTAEGGLAAPTGANVNTRVILGVGAAFQLTRNKEDFPFDIVATAGAGFSAGSANQGGSGAHVANGTVFRLPVGAVVGHSFDLERGYRLTAFVHPRLSFDRCGDCVAGHSNTKMNVDVDIGANLQVTPQVSVRVAALLGGTNYLASTDAVGFSVALTPKGLKK